MLYIGHWDRLYDISSLNANIIFGYCRIEIFTDGLDSITNDVYTLLIGLAFKEQAKHQKPLYFVARQTLQLAGFRPV